MLRVPRRSQRLSGLPVTRSVHALHRERRGARSLRDEPVLLFDDGARGSIAVEAAEDIARHPAIGALRTIFVNHVEKREFDSRCGLACHVLGFLLLLNGGPAMTATGASCASMSGKCKNAPVPSAPELMSRSGRIRRSGGSKRLTCRARSRRRS